MFVQSSYFSIIYFCPCSSHTLTHILYVTEELYCIKLKKLHKEPFLLRLSCEG